MYLVCRIGCLYFHCVQTGFDLFYYVMHVFGLIIGNCDYNENTLEVQGV